MRSSSPSSSSSSLSAAVQSIRSGAPLAVFLATSAIVVLVAIAPIASARAAEPAIPRSPRPEKAQVYLISPENGARVASPVVVRFGLRDMGVAPAGVAQPQTGHHHLIVDAEVPPAGLPIPKNDHYLHFGGGQTEVSLPLAPGKHTLQLLLGDHNHVPHDPPVVSERITIEVTK